jgi:hypothetical protein
LSATRLAFQSAVVAPNPVMATGGGGGTVTATDDGGVGWHVGCAVGAGVGAGVGAAVMGVDVAARLVAGLGPAAVLVVDSFGVVATASTTAAVTSPVTAQFHRFPQPGCRVHISSRPTGNTSSNATTVNHVDRYHGRLAGWNIHVGTVEEQNRAGDVTVPGGRPLKQQQRPAGRGAYARPGVPLDQLGSSRLCSADGERPAVLPTPSRRENHHSRGYSGRSAPPTRSSAAVGVGKLLF